LAEEKKNGSPSRDPRKHRYYFRQNDYTTREGKRPATKHSDKIPSREDYRLYHAQLREIYDSCKSCDEAFTEGRKLIDRLEI